MLHPLEEKLVALRRRVRPMAVLHGLCIVADGSVAALAVVLGLARLSCFASRTAACGSSRRWRCSACCRLDASTATFWRSLRMRLANVDLARRVQRQFPVAGRPPRHRRRVPAHRRRRSRGRLGRPAPRRSLPRHRPRADAARFLGGARSPPGRSRRHGGGNRPTRRPLSCWFCPISSAAQIAVARLINPFGNTAWPRTTHLTIRQPVERIARGQIFEIEVVDASGARLPPEVRIHYRLPTPDGGVVEETERMRFADGAMVARRENVLRPFSYRVEGGDDQTSIPWTDVEVVEPPAVESLSIRLIPPAYTGWPAASSERHIRALVGTRVQFIGKATSAARLGRSLPRRRPQDTRPTQRRRLCTFYRRRRRRQIRRLLVRIDRPRRAARRRRRPLGNPRHCRRSAQRADRAAPRPICLSLRRPSRRFACRPRTISLSATSRWCSAAANRSPRARCRCSPGRHSRRRSRNRTPAGDSRVVDYRWNLAPLNLQPGAQVTFYATASDYLPQTAKSEPRRLIVVTPDELQRSRSPTARSSIVAELERASKMQRGCRDQVESSRIRLGDLRRFEQSDVDRLQAAEHAQREVGRVAHQPQRRHSHARSGAAGRSGEQRHRQRRRPAADELATGRTRSARPRIAAAGGPRVDRRRQDGPSRSRRAGGAPPRTSPASRKSLADRRRTSRRDHRRDWNSQIDQLARWDSYRRLHREIGPIAPRPGGRGAIARRRSAAAR